MQSIYGATFKSSLAPLIRLQKKAIRYVCAAARAEHSAPLFDKAKILNFRTTYVKCLIRLMYNQLPTLPQPDHGHMTRFRTDEKLSVPKLHLEFSRRLPTATFTTLYNELPSDWKELFKCQTNHERKKCIKKAKLIGDILPPSFCKVQENPPPPHNQTKPHTMRQLN